jgi:hypothetical protein
MFLGRDTNRDTNWRLIDVLEVAEGATAQLLSLQDA